MVSIRTAHLTKMTMTKVRPPLSGLYTSHTLSQISLRPSLSEPMAYLVQWVLDFVLAAVVVAVAVATSVLFAVATSALSAVATSVLFATVVDGAPHSVGHSFLRFPLLRVYSYAPALL
jgi:hypothetical protein